MTSSTQSHFDSHPLLAALRDHLEVAVRNRDLDWEHRLGELIAEICPPRSRGRAGIPGIVTVLKGDVNLQNRLWNARAIYFAYGAKELRGLKAAAKSAGFELGISHLASAQALAKRERMQVLFRCIREKWTVVDLRREVRQRMGGQKRSGGGAPPSLPKSTEAALDEIIRHTNTWLNRFERTWFSDIEATFGQRLDRAEVNQLRDKFREADEVLSRLSTAAANGQQMLHRQLRR